MNPLKQPSAVIRPTLFIAVLLFSGCSHSGSDARTTPATAGIHGQFISPSQLVDAGNTTPEAALESDFWATANGNYDADFAFYTPQLREESKRWNGDKAQYAAHMKTKFARFKGLQVVARKTLADDRVELRYQFEFESERPGKAVPAAPDKIVSLVKLGGAWKCAKTMAYTTAWDAGSEPEPN